MKILLLEDEKTLGRQICTALETAGLTTDWREDGEDGGFLSLTESYDAIVLDLGLPKKDGLTILRELRNENYDTPVIILTARSGWRDRVDGLDAGADDYLTKPFRMEELIARLRALIRRSAGQTNPILRHAQIELDTRSGNVTVADKAINLTSKELGLLNYLIHHSSRVIPRTEISEHLYGYDADPDSNTIEVFIRRLRGKLGKGSIETVRGLGYRLGGEK